MRKSGSKSLALLKLVSQKIISLLIVVLVLAFVGYHFYSVGNLVKNFSRQTGLSSQSQSK